MEFGLGMLTGLLAGGTLGALIMAVIKGGTKHDK